MGRMISSVVQIDTAGRVVTGRIHIQDLKSYYLPSGGPNVLILIRRREDIDYRDTDFRYREQEYRARKWTIGS